MPGERTAFRKLQVILDYAKQGKHRDVGALRKYVHGRAPTNFAYFYRDRQTDEIVQIISDRSIDATIDLAVELGLLTPETGSLSKIGVAATDARRFPRIVASKVGSLLEGKGIPLAAIARVIREDLLRADPPRLPTVDAIWTRFEHLGVDAEEFSLLLRVLADAGGISVSQRRVYLPVDSR